MRLGWSESRRLSDQHNGESNCGTQDGVHRTEKDLDELHSQLDSGATNLDLTQLTSIAAIFALFVGTTEDYWSLECRCRVNGYSNHAGGCHN